MLIAFLTFVALVAIVFLVCGIVIGRTGRDALRAEIQRLRELYAAQKATLDTLDRGYEDMKRIAHESLRAAQTKHFPQEQFPLKESTESMERKVKAVMDSRADYVAPEAKNCPRCFVSVRAETWPQECPACQTLFGDEWPDTFPLD